MHDLLVPLFKLPEAPASNEQALVRAAFSAERQTAASWVDAEFGPGWASEFEYAAGLSPVSAYVAIKNGQIVGFACFDAAAKGVFGPMGVSGQWRGRGVGTALLFRALRDMRALGYAYAVIGAVGPTGYYEHTVGASPVPDGSPGFLGTLLKQQNT
ncbi:MAG: GNAT family N-acetyltransferase [Hyphomonadaceae bacterium]|nr:GNAT family N-acetyltransferase [Hyphomonadaceae bacterium]MBC6412640.1 GNAT family N-acetyltransferase [Hyphomonadaceae bacterium]